MTQTSNDYNDDQRPSMELRSEEISEAPKSQKPINKYLGIAGGVVALLIVIGLGAYAAMRPNSGNQPQTPGGIFGELPGNGEREEEPATTSGLSGVTCEHPNRRPIGVMLAGDPINRPMSGFSQADMVWELPVLTSNVTRLLALYQCGEPSDIGSVRSARHDYLFLAAGVDAIIAHWGGSYHALNRIDVGEFQSINALGNPHNAFFRKNHLPAPYNGFTTYERLWNALQKIGYRTETTFEGYPFKDDIPREERPTGGTLTVGWPGQFRVHYEYDPETNRYVRYWAGTRQVDAADNQVVAPSSVVIARASNVLAQGPGGYNDVGIEGTGEMVVYQDGKEIKGTWSKSEIHKHDPMVFKNEQGQPIIFTRGQVWVMTPSADIPVTWEVQQDTAAAGQ